MSAATDTSLDSFKCRRKLKVGKLNIDEDTGTPSNYSVRAVPTLLFFNGGEVVDTVVGFKAEGDLRGRIDKILE